MIELFKEQVPKTIENFRQLCTGINEKGLTYKGNAFHRLIADFMIQGGDITHQNGTGGISIYGPNFEDERVWIPHSHSGILSMANSGPNTNSSQFFITFKKCEWLNEKHTVFGRVISGWDIIKQAQPIKTGAQDKPLTPIVIKYCGELLGEEKLTAEQADFLKHYESPEEDTVPEKKRVEI